MMQRIEDYLLGRLNPQEIEELWIEFLKDPEWFEVFEIELMIRRLIISNNQMVSGGSVKAWRLHSS